MPLSDLLQDPRRARGLVGDFFPYDERTVENLELPVLMLVDLVGFDEGGIDPEVL